MAAGGIDRGFRLGTTSYIIPADLVPNAEALADRVDDIEIVLFEVDDGPNNLPGEEALGRLADVAETHDLSYTVHLPLDIELGSVGAADHPSLVKALRVIDKMNVLSPFAYVLHLEGKAVIEGSEDAGVWLAQAVDALRVLGDHAGGVHRLAVENLEGYPPDFLEPVIDAVGVSRCVDVGHLWLDGHEATDFLERWLDRARVVHAHGIGSRDHQSLAHVPVDVLRHVLRILDRGAFAGVFTVEVFGERDFETSIRALEVAAAGLAEENGDE